MVRVGRTIRAARLGRRLTQARLAAAAGTSQTAIAAYENGRKLPNVATLGRIAGALGATLVVDLVLLEEEERRERPIEALSREERRSLWLHRAIAVAIQRDPKRAWTVARENLATMRARDERGREAPWRSAWEDLLDGPLDVLLATLCSTSAYASQLRQTAPFSGLLAPRDRWAVYRSFQEAEVEARGA